MTGRTGPGAGARFFLQTFGCKSNQYESQAIREGMAAAGFVEAASPGLADVMILNTCGVTGRAGASCRNAIRKAVRANPGLAVAVTGCGVDLAERWPDIPSGPPLLVANAAKPALPSLIADRLEGVRAPAATGGDPFDLSISSFMGHTRAFVKVQDGCDNRCAYCAVPFARGPARSRPPADILAEAARLVGNGHPELALTGINIGVYRHGDVTFAGLAAMIAATPGLTRLRLGSVEPPQVTRELVEAMRDNPAICPHLHIPLQSGDDGVLARMGRRYRAAEFLETAAMLRESLASPALTTDVIVGFPGEDEAAFRNSLAVCREAGFSRLHVFLFSPRPGTAAAAMRRNVPDRVVESWKTSLIEEGKAAANAFAAACVGMEERVIAERSGAGTMGLTDRYVRASLPGTRANPGEAIRVKILESRGAEVTAAAL